MLSPCPGPITASPCASVVISDVNWRVFRVGEMIELEGVGLRIEIDDSVGANARLEHEIVVARAANRH